MELAGLEDGPEIVAPFTGAWIEIVYWFRHGIAYESLPSRERGLKFRSKNVLKDKNLSLPSRERGLKSPRPSIGVVADRSLPSRERGLKSFLFSTDAVGYRVAPFTGAWIEILKSRQQAVDQISRSLHGSVD